ncbi:MAG: bifunctional UDP-N-acetylglucosamine diphosphorylase/glucosamine-1-phosphate N-acetyltransferase GlmU [Acholeplasmataceae bacterium]
MRRALILAAGKGTRMKTLIPKCAFPILKKPMIEYQIEALERANVDEIIVVVGYKKDVFETLLGSRVIFVYQDEMLGTGHAVMQAKSLLEGKEGDTIILPGDMPLITAPLVDTLFKAHQEMGSDLTVVSMTQDNPKGYGRIFRDDYGNVKGIIEEKDCNDMQKQIKEVNTGTYIINNKNLFDALSQVKKNDRAGEYYLTDIVKIMHKAFKVNTFETDNPQEMMGVNTLYQVSFAEKYLRHLINKTMMEVGVYMVNPSTITIGHSVVIEEGVTILPNTTISGHTVVKKGSTIGPNTELDNAYIDCDARVNHSLVYNSKIGANTTVGPFAHVRDQADIGPNNRIGNFVEVKKSKTGNNTKAVHLSYIGDSIVGEDVNFGCGSITVNYDGKQKHQTIIGDHVFIGCNVNLVAPIEVASDSFIAAGSTVTKNVPKGAMAIAREQQINKEDYAKNFISPKKNKK